MMDLVQLGARVCILGPSNSGKSTLAEALADRLDVPAIHLDQLFHLPGTNWQPRPRAEFLAAHDKAITADKWVMDGNYSDALPQRLGRATGVIWLDFKALPCLMRYFRRTLFERNRAGHIEGGQDSLKWTMIRHIVFVQPKNRAKYAAILADQEIPVLTLDSMRALNGCYSAWDLQPRKKKGGPQTA